MKIHPLPSVECAVLHDRFNPTDGEELLKFITITAAEFGISGEVKPMVMSTDKDIYAMIGDVRVMVSQNEQPLDEEGFQSTLSYPLTEMSVPDAGELVKRHKANTFITIGKGVLDQGAIPEGLMDAFDEVVGDGGKFQTWEEAQAAMNMAGAIAEYITQTNPSTAIHWCPSDHLVTPAFFKSICEADTQIPLFMRPHLFSSEGHMGPGIPLGVVGVGSQWLIGKLVTLEEAPVPLDFAIQRLHAFIAMCHLKGELIPDGDSFGATEDEVIHVTHIAADEDCPFDQIKLSVRQAPEFGIDENVPEQVHIHYDDDGNIKNPEATTILAAGAVSEGESGKPSVPPTQKLDLDPDDDTDWAIMKALEKRKAELAAEEKGAASFAGFTAEKAEQTIVDEPVAPAVEPEVVETEPKAEAPDTDLETAEEPVAETVESVTVEAASEVTSEETTEDAVVETPEETLTVASADEDHTPVSEPHAEAAETLEPEMPSMPEPSEPEVDEAPQPETTQAETEALEPVSRKRGLDISELRKLASIEANRGKAKTVVTNPAAIASPPVEVETGSDENPDAFLENVPTVDLEDDAKAEAAVASEKPKKKSLLGGFFRRKAG